MTIAVCASAKPIYIFATIPPTNPSRKCRWICASLVSLLVVLLLAETCWQQQTQHQQHGQSLTNTQLWFFKKETTHTFPQGPDAALWPDEAQQVRPFLALPAEQQALSSCKQLGTHMR